MLRKSYDHTVIGLNYISLIHSIISMKLNHSVLIIGDHVQKNTNNWFLNIGELEKQILQNLGRRFDIAPLVNLDQYLSKKNTLLVMDDVLLELSDSPYINIKEMARKFPDCFSHVFKESLKNVSQPQFDSKFYELIETITENSFENYAQKLTKKNFEISDPLIAEVFQAFLDYLEQDTLATKQLHYVLQVIYQTVFSSGRDDLESKYLLISLLSSRYQIDHDKFLSELLYEFRKLGGDIKATAIQDWGIENDQLNYLLLNSIDGLTKTKDCFFFIQGSQLSRFETKSTQRRFFSIQVNCLLDHPYVEFYQDKRIIFSHKKRMGSDFPYWEVSFDGLGNLSATYSYADNQGTKASFYYHHALEDIYQSLREILPGISKEMWLPQVKVKNGQNIWVEYYPNQKSRLHPDHDFKVKNLYLMDRDKSITGLEYCGVDRAKSLGLYNYILDIFSPSSASITHP